MQDKSRLRTVVQWFGLIGGPVLAITCFALLPDEYISAEGHRRPFTVAGRMTLAGMIWMATWWLTEALNLSITALLPLVLFPQTGTMTMRDAAAPYADPLIFLFMGGFLLALSMQRWELDRRIALITLKMVGTQPKFIVAGMMLATAVLSAFVSNTATAAMMLPIALSVIRLAHSTRDQKVAGESNQREDTDRFAICLLLGLAYAASIGGIATIIGSPPNALLVAYVEQSIAEPFRTEISFVGWLMIGLPLVAIMLPITWILLTQVLYPLRSDSIEGGRQLIQGELGKLGPTKLGEWVTLSVFLLTATCWMFRPLLQQVRWTMAGQSQAIFSGWTDAGIAMTGAMLLFVIPVRLRDREFTMNWDTAKQLPWGILLLFGGGLSLAAAVQANGVTEFIGSHAQVFAELPTVLLVLIVATVVIFLTELTSNTATTATLLPVLAAIAPGIGIHPYMLIFPAALTASCAFMMPVATPPNAIVFGSEKLAMPEMMRAGIWLNVIGLVVVTTLTMLLLKPVFHIH